MLKKLKFKVNLKKWLLVVIFIVLLGILIYGIVSKKILFLKYGLYEGYSYGNHQVIGFEKVGNVHDYDIYIVNTKRTNQIEGGFPIMPTYYCYGEHRYPIDSVKVFEIYFIKNYRIYDLKEIIVNKLINSDDLFNALPKSYTDFWLYLDEIAAGQLPECIVIE